MDQNEVWENVASPWKIFRVRPDKEVIDFLKDKIGNILDLACGSGRNFIKINGTIYGVDFSKKMLEYAKKHAKEEGISVEFKKTDITKLPFEDNFFDSAIFVRSLHCIETEEGREKALSELFRVLKPGTEALITVWNYNQQRFKNLEKDSFIPWEHEGKKFMRFYHLYEKEELFDLLKKVGFENINVSDTGNLIGTESKKNIHAIVRKG
jgi:ubiquinone/menaquinone biosynthesis C-methylase UbiE|tara:strand:+ start:148 stop:774 length:627 start_codon:yes stop_codon:yes gene_type:complete